MLYFFWFCCNNVVCSIAYVFIFLYFDINFNNIGFMHTLRASVIILLALDYFAWNIFLHICMYNEYWNGLDFPVTAIVTIYFCCHLLFNVDLFIRFWLFVIILICIEIFYMTLKFGLYFQSSFMCQFFLTSLVTEYF